MENNETLKEHHKQQLEDKVCKFFSTYEITNISALFNDLAFYTANPKESDYLEKETITRMLTDSMNLLNELIAMSALYEDYRIYIKPTGKQYKK